MLYLLVYLFVVVYRVLLTYLRLRMTEQERWFKMRFWSLDILIRYLHIQNILFIIWYLKLPNYSIFAFSRWERIVNSMLLLKFKILIQTDMIFWHRIWSDGMWVLFAKVSFWSVRYRWCYLQDYIGSDTPWHVNIFIPRLFV